MLPRTRIEALDVAHVGHWTYVLVRTDRGQLGVGESSYFTHPRAIAAVVEDLRASLIGADAYAPEYLYQRALKQHCMIDAASASALSAIDQALWDIKARALDVPVWQLLGGRVRERVRAILLLEAATEESLFTEVQRAMEEGFTAIKIKPFLGDWALLSRARLLREIVDRVRAVRRQLGWDIDLAVEVHRNLPPALAIDLARQLEDQQLYFIEDPVLPFSAAVNARVASAMPATVALAERNSNIWEFREYSDMPGVDILRPDAGLAGGFTQLRKIAAIAESRQQRIVPHNFSSPLLTAVHIQCAAALHNWDLQGYVREHREPWTSVVRAVNRLEQGYLHIPETPGIGLEVNEEVLMAGRYEAFGQRFGHRFHTAADGSVALK